MSYPPLYILRHGQTVWNAQCRIQGSLDSPLTEMGVSQALSQRKLLENCNLREFSAFSSPQGRAFHTAAIALAGLLPEIATDIRLREIGVGLWEGKSRSELPQIGAVEESEESALNLYEQAPQGEGFQALRIRCKEFLDALPGPTVIVTHGITSRMLRLIALDKDMNELGLLPGGQGVVYHIENGKQSKLSIGA